MPILDAKNQAVCEEIDAFLRTHPNGWFTQALCWPQVKKEPAEVIYARDEAGKLLAAAVVLVKRVAFLNRAFLYLPRGPVLDWKDQTALAALMGELQALAHARRACKIVLDPQIRLDDADTLGRIEAFGFVRESPSNDQSGLFYTLRLQGKSMEELFASFHPKWRYNIRLAMRKGVECRACGPEALEAFYPMWCETARRDGFQVRSKDYLYRYMEAFGADCRLYLCCYQGAALSGALAVRYAGKVSYVFGASSAQHRAVMPNYLMQYEMIRWAVESGCGLYDFGGLPHYQNRSDEHTGVFGFKRGFRGEITAYAVGFVKVESRMTDALVRLGKRVLNQSGGG